MVAFSSTSNDGFPQIRNWTAQRRRISVDVRPDPVGNYKGLSPIEARMNRREVLILTAAVQIPLAGCSNSVDPAVEGEGDVPIVEFGRTVEFDVNVAVTVEGVEFYEERQYVAAGTNEEKLDRPEAGNVFAIVTVTARNNNVEEDPQAPFPGHNEFTLKFGESEYDHRTTNHPDRFDAGPPEPGEERTGVIRFQVPEEHRDDDPVVILDFLFHGRPHTVGWSGS